MPNTASPIYGAMNELQGGNSLLPHIMAANPKVYLERVQELGLRLADENPRWKALCEGLTKHDKSNMAILFENLNFWVKGFDETLRAQQIGNFDKFSFPLIRAIFPNLIAQEIVSVQAMPGPTSLIFYLDFVFGSNKGQIQAGQSAFDAISGPTDSRFYSSDDIDQEVIGTGDAVATAFNGTLAYIPVQSGTVQVQAGAVIGFDDGNGNITGTGIAVGSVINYQTGVFTINFTVAPALNVTVAMTYRYDSEANDNIPQMDLQLTSSPVSARHRKLRTRWSIEAQASLKSLHGLDAQAELASFTAEEIKFEIDREVINDLFTVAMAGQVNWSITVPAGVSFTEHKLSIIDAMIEQSNLVYLATRRGQTNFQVMSVDVANIVESLPTFVAEPGAFQTQQSTGVVKSGVLNNRWVCYKDPFLGAGLPNRRVWFAGYKGTKWMDAGYVYAPYLQLYATPAVYLDDFVGRKGLGTAYGKRVVNGRFYATGAIVN